MGCKHAQNILKGNIFIPTKYIYIYTLYNIYEYIYIYIDKSIGHMKLAGSDSQLPLGPPGSGDPATIIGR